MFLWSYIWFLNTYSLKIRSAMYNSINFKLILFYIDVKHYYSNSQTYTWKTIYDRKQKEFVDYLVKWTTHTKRRIGNLLYMSHLTIYQHTFMCYYSSLCFNHSLTVKDYLFHIWWQISSNCRNYNLAIPFPWCDLPNNTYHWFVFTWADIQVLQWSRKCLPFLGKWDQA